MPETPELLLGMWLSYLFWGHVGAVLRASTWLCSQGSLLVVLGGVWENHYGAPGASA